MTTCLGYGSRPKIHFNWSVLSYGCHDYNSINYSITTSNCGSCPNITNHTSITCIDRPTDGSMCNLSVQAVICDGEPQGITITVLKCAGISKCSEATICYLVHFSILSTKMVQESHIW